MPTLITVVEGGALYLAGVSIFTKAYEVYLRVWEGHPPADNNPEFYNDNF